MSGQTAYHLETDEIRANCLREISMLPIKSNKMVVIKDKKQTRSEAQLRLKWMWCGFLAKERAGNEGRDREDWNRFFKGKFMRALLLEQDEEFHDFFTNADRLLESAADEENRNWAKKTIIDAMKTEWLNTKNMSEFMTSIDRHCQHRYSVQLPIPDDLKWAVEK
jgi:hypothetical protein